MASSTESTDDTDVLDTSSVSTDRPIEKLEEDELGHRAFAEAVAQGIDQGVGPEGLVIALHGKWGSGKTSAVNMAADALRRLQADRDEANQAVIVRFNPWWFSEQKDLVRAFFTEVSAAIGEKLSADIRDGFRKIAKRVSGATDFLAGLMSLTPVGLLAKPIADVVRAAGEGITDEKSLDDIRGELAAALKSEKRSLVVIIDDVDRLPPDEARQIFRLVKSVDDLPYVTYLLVFDSDIAAQSMHRSVDAEGPEWLEKIIQVSFDLPPVSQSDLTRLLFKRLNRISADYAISDHTRWGNILYGVVMPWVRSPRDVDRLSNTIAMAWPPLKDEVDFPDLLGIETLRLFEPRLYAFLRTQRDEITGHESQRGDRQSLEAYGQMILSNVDGEKHGRVKRALCYLFPRLDAVFNNTWHGSDWRDAELNKRIESKRRFPIYFNLGVDDGILTKPELDAAFASLSDPEEFRNLVITYVAQRRRNGGTRAGVLLDALSSQAHSGFGIPDEVVVRAMFAGADLFLNSPDGQSTAEGFPRSWSVSWMIDPPLTRLAPKQIEEALIEALEGPSLYMAAFFLYTLSKEHGHGKDEEAKPKDERRLTLAAIKRLEKRHLKRIEADARSGALLSAYELASHLYAWRDLGDEGNVRQWIEDRLDDDQFAAQLMRSVTSEGVGHAYGDMVGRVTYNVNRPSLETLLDIDRLKGIAERLVRENRDEESVASRFLKGLNSRF